MQLFNKILVPIDFSSISKIGVQRAIDTALKCNSEELHLISVVDINTIGYLVAVEPGIMMNYASLKDDLSEAENKILAIKKEIESESKAKIYCKVVSGNLTNAINSYLNENDINLVVMATSGTDGIKEYIFGSNSQRLASEIDCPILTIHSNSSHNIYEKIILPVEDFYPKNKLTFAIELAKIFDSEIHLVCLKTQYEDSNKVTESILFRILEELKTNEIKNKIFVSGGNNITDSILRYSEKEAIDLILVNPGEESTLTGKIFNALGGQIINHAEAPILTIKRDL